jgi:hypothetical protein
MYGCAHYSQVPKDGLWQEGFIPSLRSSKRGSIAGDSLRILGAGPLLVCLADEIGAAEVEPRALRILAWHKELATAAVGKTDLTDRHSPAAQSQQCEELVKMATNNPEKVQQPRPLEGGLIRVGHGSLMDRVVSILEQARANVARAVNSNMVIAYWLIGREIVEALQSGEDRAEYGQSLLNNLSEQLTARYGQGFSVTNLRNFRLFYQAFSDREPAIHHSASDELATLAEDAVLIDLKTALDTTDRLKGFSPNLSWTHYRTLCKIEHRGKRRFYEIEAEKSGWSVSVLERQIHASSSPACSRVVIKQACWPWRTKDRRSVNRSMSSSTLMFSIF